MNCMKCGRESGPEQVFCADCLAEMEKYPVKPGTVVMLPPQPKQTQMRRQPRRRATLSPEEQVKFLKKQVRLLVGLLALALAMLIAVSSFALWRMDEEDVDILPGQNYSSEETTAPDEPR